MKTFTRMAAQGDVLLQAVASFPEGIEKVEPEGNLLIVAHSETGHHHVLEATREIDGKTEEAVELYRLPEEIYEMLLQVNHPTPLIHQREFDTHEPIMVPPGKYRVRRQREHTPEGFRLAAD